MCSACLIWRIGSANVQIPLIREHFVATNIEEITKEIVELPRHQRLALIRLLLDLDQPGTTGEIDSAWDAEIRARVKAIDEGRAVGIQYEQIQKEMAERFARR
jgi:putative addiction module component (TIGR02574 family)